MSPAGMDVLTMQYNFYGNKKQVLSNAERTCFFQGRGRR